MRRLNIASREINETNYILSFLEKEYNLVEPSLTISSNEIIKNFDIYFIFDDVGFNNDVGTCSLYNLIDKCNIPTIGFGRHEKTIQYLILDKLGIQHPNIYKKIDSSMNINTLTALLDDIEENEYVVFKMERGARGIGQAKILKSEIEDFLEVISDRDIDNNVILLEKYNIGGFSKIQKEVYFEKTEIQKIKQNEKTEIQKEEKYELIINDTQKSLSCAKAEVDISTAIAHLRNNIINSTYHIEKYIDVVEEYRYVYCYRQAPIVVKRNISKDNWQNNGTINGAADITFSKDKKIYKLKKEMSAIAEKISEEMKSPVFGIDFYVDSDGNLGVFEFQQEMGYKFVDKKAFLTNIRLAFNSYIVDKFPELLK